MDCWNLGYGGGKAFLSSSLPEDKRIQDILEVCFILAIPLSNRESMDYYSYFSKGLRFRGILPKHQDLLSL